jgi:ABC-type Na+ efflux pump permease subunit
MFIDVIYGAPASPVDLIFSFFVKWFHIIALALYMPIAYMLFRKYGLRSGEGFLALTLFFVLSFDRFHYAAQTYTNALFWLLLATPWRD